MHCVARLDVQQLMSVKGIFYLLQLYRDVLSHTAAVSCFSALHKEMTFLTPQKLSEFLAVTMGVNPL
jgi:hypothetical protein